MILLRSTVVMFLSAALLVPPAIASRVHRAPTSGGSRSSSKSTTAAKTTGKPTSKTTASSKASSHTGKPHKGKRKTSRRARGQQSIDRERATQIQQALIREHYLTGDPSGAWDATSIAAMQKYQADQGWQTRLTPDPRALKKLGLGPDYSSAINAKEGKFVPPPPENSIPSEQASGFATAAGVNQ